MRQLFESRQCAQKTTFKFTCSGMPGGGASPKLVIEVNTLSTQSSTRALPVLVVNLISFTRPSAATKMRVDTEPLADLVQAADAKRSRMESRMRFVYHAYGAVPVPPIKSLPPRRAASPKASPPAEPSASTPSGCSGA